MMQQPPPNVMGSSAGVGLSGVDHYQSSSTRLHPQQSGIHPHPLMQQQPQQQSMYHSDVFEDVND